jgi:purine nucleoside phosphorylase
LPIKLPLQYPPEIPINTAQQVLIGSGVSEFKSSILLGPSLTDELKALITSRKHTLEIGKENEAMGFSLIDCGESPPSVCYSCDSDEPDDAIEKMSFAIHVFKWLGIESVMIIDGVSALGNINSAIVRIGDHINMTGINPLDYWMMPAEPEEFFLDAKSLYILENLSDYPSVTHLATSESTSEDILSKAMQTGAVTFGRAIVPESLIAGYLGMRVRALGLVDTKGDDEAGKISDEILYLIR